ncbi:hypothetical protein ANAYA_73 [Mycobacterium phage Anaya]|uniref:Uncharacterized protein n=1 Tax=Mycobacterium phage Anaya TaxID=2902832 RepID=G1BQ21_9CAUD|nr:hypothetical protein FDI60_gp32 [Mycobacterium phage Anaya]AEK08032.1 hypothetical protein ANAYA_73 [Mycobacterium phage Anaya]
MVSHSFLHIQLWSSSILAAGIVNDAGQRPDRPPLRRGASQS